jgi:hypothetical protein
VSNGVANPVTLRFKAALDFLRGFFMGNTYAVCGLQPRSIRLMLPLSLCYARNPAEEETYPHTGF